MNFKPTNCKECGTLVTCSESLIVTCWLCTQKATCMDDTLPKPKRKPGYPRGWKFMKLFVHADGQVFHKGVEQPDLNGTLAATELKVPVKDTRSKAQKRDDKLSALLQLGKLQKQLRGSTKKATIKQLRTQIKKLQKAI